MKTYSKQTARRFVLGKQGLWPGRRWTGEEGTAAAMRASEGVQMDPLSPVARAHHIFLWSRTHAYDPASFYRLLYEQRRFFDYGGNLHAHPMEDLPYWRTEMRGRHMSPRIIAFKADHPGLMEAMLEEVRERGPVGNRDFAGKQRVVSYRGSKDSSVALFYLWLVGELMIHHREDFERVYDLRDRIAPTDVQWEAPESDAEAFFARKSVATFGIMAASLWRSSLMYVFERLRDRKQAADLLDSLVERGVLAPILVHGSKLTQYVLSEDVALLDTLEAGDVPPAWTPLDTTTLDEAVFLSPLDIVSARGRAAKLFEFEYIWEVYKPAEARRWGYYTLPILYGDRLVARIDSRLERASNTLIVNGFWLEPDAPNDKAFARALDRGLEHFAAFAGATAIDRAAITRVLE